MKEQTVDAWMHVATRSPEEIRGRRKWRKGEQRAEGSVMKMARAGGRKRKKTVVAKNVKNVVRQASGHLSLSLFSYGIRGMSLGAHAERGMPKSPF